jgi:hypothetical protein
MIVLMARCTASMNVVSPGAAWAVSGARPAKKLATAVPAAPGGVRGRSGTLPLIALTASGIIDALCRSGDPLLAIHCERWLGLRSEGGMVPGG